MDGIIADLIRRRSVCEQEIADQNQKIRRYEKAYESLRQFRGEESRARDSFQRINSVKLSRASELYAVSSTCRTAQLYMEGSQRTMDGIGAKIVGGVIDVVVFFCDPLTAQPHDPDVKALMRIAQVYDIPMAVNRATADFMITSLYMDTEYDHEVINFKKNIKERADSM